MATSSIFKAYDVRGTYPDGLITDYGEWWFNVRPSNTEPLWRWNVEAATDEGCAAHVGEVLALIKGAQ